MTQHAQRIKVQRKGYHGGWASSSPLHIAVINGIITNAANGQAYFPLTVAVTGTVQKLFFEVWATDANGETYPIDSGSLIITGSLK